MGVLRLLEVSFQWKNPDFLLKNPDFLLKNDAFVLKQAIRCVGLTEYVRFYQASVSAQAIPITM